MLRGNAFSRSCLYVCLPCLTLKSFELKSSFLVGYTNLHVKLVYHCYRSMLRSQKKTCLYIYIHQSCLVYTFVVYIEMSDSGTNDTISIYRLRRCIDLTHHYWLPSAVLCADQSGYDSDAAKHRPLRDVTAGRLLTLLPLVTVPYTEMLACFVVSKIRLQFPVSRTRNGAVMSSLKQ